MEPETLLFLLVSSIISLLVACLVFLFLFLRTKTQTSRIRERYGSIDDIDKERENTNEKIESLSLLLKKYAPIYDVEKERERIQKEIASLSLEIHQIKASFLSKREKLSSEYESAHRIYETLQKEIHLLEESLDMIEFGVYKPHFDFGSSDEYRRELEILREKQKEMIRSDKSVVCDTEWTVSGSKAEGKRMTKQNHKLMLRAFNGECEAALAKIRWDNVSKMEERVKKAFETINKSGEVNRSHITEDYLELKIKELRIAYEYQEKIKQEKDEQKQIQEEMREEEKARREIERAKEEAEKEEARYQKALEKARDELLKASGDKVDQLNDKILQLEEQLKAAQALKERAISRAQITRSGHIYIISNIGSFGGDVFKIGMTRRLEPLDRVKELGDASVPFGFDVHAMVYSDNAPDLESKLHRKFETNRMNLVNLRREFFNVNLADIERWAKEENIDLRLTKIAEAREYRESLAIRAKGEENVRDVVEREIPETINALFSEDEA